MLQAAARVAHNVEAETRACEINARCEESEPALRCWHPRRLKLGDQLQRDLDSYGLIRARRFLSFVRSFLATAFLIVFMPDSGLGSVGAGMEEILSSSASICREISSPPLAFFMSRTPG
jgi:hypothetical protein